jgi:hypothetical protein
MIDKELSAVTDAHSAIFELQSRVQDLEFENTCLKGEIIARQLLVNTTQMPVKDSAGM